MKINNFTNVTWLIVAITQKCVDLFHPLYFGVRHHANQHVAEMYQLIQLSSGENVTGIFMFKHVISPGALKTAVPKSPAVHWHEVFICPGSNTLLRRHASENMGDPKQYL